MTPIDAFLLGVGATLSVVAVLVALAMLGLRNVLRGRK